MTTTSTAAAREITAYRDPVTGGVAYDFGDDEWDSIIHFDDWIEDDETIYNPQYMERFK